MYVPKHFSADDPKTLARYMREASFATLVSTVDGSPYASHLPLYFEARKGEYGTLYGHVAKANDHWKTFREDTESLAIFTGINAYISPNWLQSKNAVPTWNYVAVHAYGSPQPIEDAQATLDVLAKLSRANENEITGNWTMDKMDASVLHGMLKGIVAFEMPVSRLEGKRKMSQNKPMEDQRSAIAGLRTMDMAQATAIADDMETALKKPS